MIKYSIIIPVYNVEAYLRDCLDSVLQQSYINYEIICVNDGSTDQSQPILDEYVRKDDRVRVIFQKNKGLSGARNTGVREAKGEYIFFLDSDDWIVPDTLDLLNRKTSGEDMICFSGKLFYEESDKEVTDTPLPDAIMTGWEYYNAFALKHRFFSFVCAVLRLYKRDFLIRNALFFKEGIYHEDNLFTPIACYYAKEVRLISESLYIYRIRSGSITNRPEKKRMYDMLATANELSDFFIPRMDIDKTVVYKALAGIYYLVFLDNIQKEFLLKDRDVIPRIKWNNFKVVSVFKRHKIIYHLLRINPGLFRLFIKIEKIVKRKS